MNLVVIYEVPQQVRARMSWCTKRFFVSLAQRAVQHIPKMVMRRFGAGEPGVSVVVVDGRTIRALNKRFRGIDAMTDVLTFDADPAEYPYMGEIILCLSVAKRQARQFGRTVQQEVALLFVHGILHLCGYDHGTARERKEMFVLQDDILGEHIRYTV